MTLDPSLDRLEELLAQRAIDRLSPTEAYELSELLRKWPDVDESSFDRAAAAIAAGDVPVAVSPELLAKLTADAQAFFAPPEPRRTRSSASWLLWSGWLATAICLMAAVWWARPVSPVDRFNTLVRATETLRRPATRPADKTPAGEVVWNTRQQEGFLVLTGLPINDPKREQYQLWIFDKTRDERYPVDGGVFDVTTGEAVIPIRAKLPVREPTLFAVTVERPGGVVVSDRSQIVWVAAR